MTFERAIFSDLRDRTVGVSVLLAMVALFYPFTWRLTEDTTALLALTVRAAAGVATRIILFGLSHPLARAFARVRSLRFVSRFVFSLSSLLASRALMTRVVAASLAVHHTSILALWSFCLSLDAGLRLGAILVLSPPIIFLSMLPISISGWGIQAGTMITISGFVGVPNEAAFLIALLYGMCFLVVSFPGRLVWLTADRKDGPSGSAQADSASGLCQSVWSKEHRPSDQP